MKAFVFFLISSVLLVGIASAQMQPEIKMQYTENIPFHQEVISGGHYVDPPYNIDGHPYFLEKNFEIGYITLNGLFYEGVPILYDIQKDLVITFHPIHRQKTIIQTEKINSFFLLEPKEVQFIRIENNSNYSNHNNGFYELVIDGNAQLLCKHYKSVSSKKEIGKYNGSFITKSDFLLKRENEILLVTKRKKVFGFLGLEKKTIKKELKGKGVYFKRDQRSYLSLITEFFNNQTK